MPKTLTRLALEDLKDTLYVDHYQWVSAMSLGTPHNPLLLTITMRPVGDNDILELHATDTLHYQHVLPAEQRDFLRNTRAIGATRHFYGLSLHLIPRHALAFLLTAPMIRDLTEQELARYAQMADIRKHRH